MFSDTVRTSRDNRVTPDSLRVLQRLLATKRPPSGLLSLRRIAVTVLNGDSERAAKVLAELDGDGYIRTDTMGWLTGRLTEKARRSIDER